MRVMKTQTIKMLMSKRGRARRKWAKRTTKPAERVKMPSQRASVAQGILTV